ncbi:MAG: (d)CMP kinase [Mycobacteriales bacterium]
MSTPPPPRIIALDGPSGSGKSTVAKAVARHLGWRYLDTGATYRAVTLAVLRAGVDLADSATVAQVAAAADVRPRTDPDAPGVDLDGAAVDAEIRGPAVTAAVSAVSAVPAVRAQLVALQREVAGQDAVIEGRDIGTAVFPDAPVKVFLDADVAVRAQRRSLDAEVGVNVPSGDVVDAVAADLARRDRLDTARTASPLVAAADAVHLDATELTADEVIAKVLLLAEAAGLGPA